jgi:hypothetical protein
VLLQDASSNRRSESGGKVIVIPILEPKTALFLLNEPCCSICHLALSSRDFSDWQEGTNWFVQKMAAKHTGQDPRGRRGRRKLGERQMIVCKHRKQQLLPLAISCMPHFASHDTCF